MQIKNLTAEGVGRFFKSAMIQVKLEDLGYELMFLDEFSINFRQKTAYGWAPVRVKGFLDVNAEPFSMSFMVGFSRQRFYGIFGTTSSNNSNSFLRFVKNAIEHRTNDLKIEDKRFIIVWDNASLHISEEVKRYLSNTEVIICTIAPYSPCLNPAERLILYIKKKVMKIRQIRRLVKI